jgi:hypothetical protein
MNPTTEQLEAASEYVLAVRTAAMEAIAKIPPPKAWDDPGRTILMSVDGLIAVIAMYVEASGLAATPRDKRHFADECRAGLLKGMKAARVELDTAFAAND